MDSTEQFTTLEWCAGYGGIQLGLKRAIPNLRTVAYSEIEAFACANLVAKMEAGLLDQAPIWTDLKTFPCQQFRGKVDCLIAGYPCQPFSAAGKRQGADDQRHLWPHIREAVRIIRPRYCFFENVEGHISLGLSTVISDLEEDGYRATWGIFSAAEVGAPHQRKRVFILANCGESGSQGYTRDEQGTGRQGIGEDRPATKGRLSLWPARPGEPQHEWEPPRVVANNRSEKQQGLPQAEERQQGFEAGESSRVRQTQPPLGGNADGSSDWMDNAELYETCDNRTDELRLLGNGVVPATAERAWRVLHQRLKGV